MRASMDAGRKPNFASPRLLSFRVSAMIPSRDTYKLAVLSCRAFSTPSARRSENVMASVKAKEKIWKLEKIQ